MSTLLCRFCEEDLTKRKSSYKNNYCNEECYKFYWQKRVREIKKKSYYKNREKHLEKNRLWRLKNPNYKKEWDKENREHIRDYWRKYCVLLKKVNPSYFKDSKNGKLYLPYKGLDKSLYKSLISKCAIKNCGFTDTVDLHHIDRNKKNNDSSNLIGLCPNHHQLLHRHKLKLVFKNNFWVLIKK